MIRVGVIGTSAWTERMYVGGLAAPGSRGQVVAVCGRNLGRTRDFAARNQIPSYFTDYRDLLDSGEVDAVIIATPNHTHYPITMDALANGLHVLCEKPLAMTYAQADAMATEAKRRGLVNMTAFTYNYFPHYRYLAQLVREGFIGTPHHLNMRYYSSLGLAGEPLWRFDRATAGEGALADIGSHALALTHDIIGPPASVSAHLATHVLRGGIPPERRASDAATLTLHFDSGAVGVVHVSMAAYQPKVGGVKQAVEVVGREGTLYYANDFSTHFSLQAARPGDTEAYEVRVPDDVWDPRVSRANPQQMYSDLFTKTNTMAREFVSAIAENRAVTGASFADGADVQRVIDAAIASHQNGSQMVDL